MSKSLQTSFITLDSKLVLDRYVFLEELKYDTQTRDSFLIWNGIAFSALCKIVLDDKNKESQRKRSKYVRVQVRS